MAEVINFNFLTTLLFLFQTNQTQYLFECSTPNYQKLMFNYRGTIWCRLFPTQYFPSHFWGWAKSTLHRAKYLFDFKCCTRFKRCRRVQKKTVSLQGRHMGLEPVLRFEKSSMVELCVKYSSSIKMPSSIWVNCYCWGNSSMVEGRFSKWF